MAREVRGYLQAGSPGGRAGEEREPEPSGDDQPAVTMIPAGERPGGAPSPLTVRLAEERSRLGRYVGLSALPADKAGLRAEAERQQAPADVLVMLDRLPAGASFGTVAEIWAALGNPNEQQRW